MRTRQLAPHSQPSARDAAFPASRRQCLQTLGALWAASALPLHAQTPAASDWPARPVRFVLGSAAGDPNDVTLRRLLQAIAPELNNTQSIVDNKPGAGGILAHQEVLRSPADGYSVLFGNAAMTILPHISKKLPYNPQTDFVPVCFSGMAAVGLAIPASRPEKTLKEWLAWAKQQKGKLDYGSGGNGSVPHLYGYQISDDFDLEATHIAQRGTTPVLRDLAAGTIDYTVLDILSLRAQLANGQLRLLAVTGTERSRYVPDTPTFKELGVEGFERMGWNAWYVKAGTPQAYIDKLANANNKTLQRPEWVAFRDQFWIDWKPMSQAEIVAQVKRETEAWGKLVKKVGYTAD